MSGFLQRIAANFPGEQEAVTGEEGVNRDVSWLPVFLRCRGDQPSRNDGVAYGSAASSL